MSATFSRRRRVVAGLALATTVTLLALAPASLASAHDEVASTAPASQQNLDAVPDAVSMVFTDDILDIGATFLVVDESEKNWALGDMQVQGTEATQAVDPDMPDGRYQVRWRVVSSDGHPISGTFDFAIGEVGAASDKPAAQGVPDPAATLEAATDSDATRNAVAAPPFVVIGIGGALAGIALFALIIMLRPRRKRA